MDKIALSKKLYAATGLIDPTLEELWDYVKPSEVVETVQSGFCAYKNEATEGGMMASHRQLGKTPKEALLNLAIYLAENPNRNTPPV